MCLGFSNALGRVFLGWLSDRIGRVRGLRLLFVLQLVNLFVFPLYGSYLVFALGALVAGFCYGGMFSVIPALVGDLYGMVDFGRNYVLVYTPAGVLAALGPFFGGWVADRWGSFGPAFLVSGVLVFGAFVLSFLLPGRGSFGRE